MKCTMLCIALMCGVLGCMPIEELVDGETLREGLWAEAQKDLVDAHQDADVRIVWTHRIKAALLNIRRTKATLNGEDFDIEAERKKLGIEKTGGGE